jgi:orotate phosphoribosyltransferase
VNAFTIRKEPKAHGAGRQVEGNLQQGDRVVVVEDVITTGNSARWAIAAAEEAGAVVLGVLGVVDRLAGGRELLEADGRVVVVLTTIHHLGLVP